VQTYVTYLKNATSLFLSKGAKVIISSPTPNNPWEYGNYSYTPTIFTYYSWYHSSPPLSFSIQLHHPTPKPNIHRLSVSQLGGTSSGVYFLPHSQYAAHMMQNLGIGIDQYFPLDHGHTAPYLASLVAQSFVLGLKCGTAPLQGLVTNATSRIEGGLLGTCLGVNRTLPI